VTYLLDTNILSEAAKARPHPAFLDWFNGTPDGQMHVSVITIGEIRKGVEKLRPADPRRAASLAEMLAGLEEDFRDRILDVNTRVAHAWGPLDAVNPGHPLDNYLAATAQVHGLTLVTRNTKDFTRLGVPLLDPFAPAAG
jgi:predicted nucleic acid-binding protein